MLNGQEQPYLCFPDMCKQLTSKGYAVLRLPLEEADIVRGALRGVSAVLSKHRDEWLRSEISHPTTVEQSSSVRITSDPLRSQLRWAGGKIPADHSEVSESVTAAMGGAWNVLERLARECLHFDPVAEANAESPRSENGESGHIMDVFFYGRRGQGPMSTTDYPMEPHVDRGLLTLVMADCPSLEVLDQKWIELPLQSNDVAFLAGSGWTNSHLNPNFSACTHRVKHRMTKGNSSELPRCSFTFEIRQSIKGWENISKVLQQREAILFAKQIANDADAHWSPSILKSFIFKHCGLPSDLVNTILDYILPLRPTLSMLSNQLHRKVDDHKASDPDLDLSDVLVIDCGGDETHCGFGGDSEPRCVFPTVVGRPRHRGVMVGMGKKDSYVGAEATSKRAILTLKYPIERNMIVNWDDMEKILHHSFYNEMRVAPEEHCLLITEPLLSSKAQRERMVQVMFEVFCAPAICIISQPVLALYSARMTTGVVVDIGSSFTHVVPIADGIVILPAVKRMLLGGQHLTQFLWQLLFPQQQTELTFMQKEAAHTLKEKLCYVAANYENETVIEKEFKWPDESSSNIGKAQFQCPEALFQPSLASVEGDGLPFLIHQAISSCDSDLQKALWGGVVLTGGSSMFPGLHERLDIELKKLAPPSIKISLSAPMKCAAWLGGSVVSTVACFEKMYLTLGEYNEFGPSCIHDKNF